ncbi:MAG: hypothetical protein KDA85_20440, partial [Planctomycetaceae bacterium]|nr:hypothetical protein [Planctomycetaceae bacterium]
LAHAYHDQKLGFDHPAIKTTYDQAAAAPIYAAVQRNNGRTEAAYAISNPREYFAESSEAFFGINDFYPSNRRELADHDPRMHDLLIKLWGVSNVAPVPQNNGQQSQ